MTNAREILVRGPNWAGDLVMATPAFRALHAAFPAARITLALRPGLAPLLAGAPWFHELLEVRSQRRGLAALAREARTLRARRFDLGVCLPDSFSSALWMRLAGVRRVVGYAADLRRPLLHVPVAPPRRAGRRAWVPRERHTLGVVEAVGAEPRGIHLELFVTPDETRRAGEALRETGVDPAAPLVVMAPGASYGASKRWPVASFARVGDALTAAGARVVLCGAPDEAEIARAVARAMLAPPADLTGRIDLGALKAVIRCARAVVCNDAGARHVAVAFGVPCLVLMGPTSLEKTPLNLERVRVLTADVGCRPCYLRACPVDHRCMTGIDPEAVVRAVLPTLDDAGRRAWRGDGALRPVAGGGGSA